MKKKSLRDLKNTLAVDKSRAISSPHEQNALLDEEIQDLTDEIRLREESV